MEPGQTVGKYKVGDRVGQGGMSVVYRGTDTVLARCVAIKVLHQHLAESGEAKARFAREAKAVARLRHANILEIYDYSGTAEDAHYIISEFIDGHTLKECIEQHPIALPEIGAAIVWHLAKAVAHAHEMGVLHRDLKPENVMVRKDGVIKLTDFGIAHVLELGKLTVTGQLLGSPAYMAPEHVEGRALSAQTDIFSLGTILYQLCVGALPFTGTNAHEILLKIADGRFADPTVANPAIGNELAHIMRTALAVEPSARFASANAMAEALERYLEGSGITDPRTACTAYFADPAGFTTTATQRVTETLVTRAQLARKQRNRAACLDIRNRLSALAPGHPAITALQDAEKQRRRNAVLLMACTALLGGSLVWVGALQPYLKRMAAAEHARRQHATSLAPAVRLLGNSMSQALSQRVAKGSTEPPSNTPDKIASLASHKVAAPTPIRPIKPAVRPSQPDLDGAKPLPALPIVLQVSPPNSMVQIDDGPWRALAGGRVELTWAGKPIRIAGRNEACCENAQRTLTAADVGRTVGLALSFLPARVLPQCARPGTTAQINGRPARLGSANIIAFGDSTQARQSITVEFIGESVVTKRVQVRANETVTVTCDAAPN